MAEIVVALAAASLPPLSGFACLYGLQSWSDKQEPEVRPFENAFKSIANMKASEPMRKIAGVVETKLKIFKK